MAKRRNDDAAKVLEESIGCITSERSSVYGPYENESDRACKLFEVITGIKLDPKHVAILMMCVKLAREANLHNRDNLVDLCGYAGLYNQLAEAAEDE